MLRAAVIALGVCLVALATAGMRGGTAAGGPPEAAGSVSPAPLPPATDPAVRFRLDAPSDEATVRSSGGSITGEGEEPGVGTDFFPHESTAQGLEEPDSPEARLRFPRKEEWQGFARRLDLALAAKSLDELAALEPDARAALDSLRSIPGHVEYADWLQDRLDDIAVARLAAQLDEGVLPGDITSVPLYDVWLDWMQHRPAPARAWDFVPQLKPIFIAHQLPPALVWLAETESSFNPLARNPQGARGLYQIMPATARELGLRLRPDDERLNPVLNAEYAARYLAYLHGLYHDWPLALAAYNAGPTRVSRLLQAHGARTFGEIAAALPVETQLYVPKALATLTVREGLTPAALQLTQAALVRD